MFSRPANCQNMRTLPQIVFDSRATPRDNADETLFLIVIP